MSALAALTERSLISAARDGELVFELVSPIAYLAGFSVALQGLIDTGEISYSQYLVPAVIVQSMIYVGLVAADRAVRDRLCGFGRRLQTLPVAAAAPVTARMTATLVRAVGVLTVAIAAGFVIGFRITGGPVAVAGFVLFSLLLCLAVGLGADALGSRSRSVYGASYVLLVFSLLLFLLSTGIAPEETFPEWLQPWVRNQPVSQVAETLRGLASGNVALDNVAVSLAWCVGMALVFGAITVRMQRRDP
ncbi:ABC transporter [Mycobacterium lehmannii]|uniref:ABC transporter n=1 Tax=Mycobacterium lehmannii TaxID=2048550 RepID=A0A101A6T4_9MYCO|nr:ABC transporter permease [Mycobacterium lehmannii]KUI15628.1 ABC transporter [Mycobacterium lehmannii]